jgi:hypothetical protein
MFFLRKGKSYLQWLVTIFHLLHKRILFIYFAVKITSFHPEEYQAIRTF